MIGQQSRQVMWSKSGKNDIEAVQKVLGEPIAVGLSDRAWRARTQLLVTSVLAIAVVGFKLRVNSDATLFGFRLTGLTDHAVRVALATAIIYLAAHFTWIAWESFLEWRLRLTGTRVAFVTTGRFANAEGDYPSDPRQSTLLNWWLEAAQRIGDLRSPIRDIEAKIAQQDQAIRKACEGGSPLNVANATSPLNAILTSIQKLRSAIESTEKVLRAPRIPASLERFESTYRLFLSSQNVRWLTVDAFLPLAVASAAIAVLCAARSG
jgi:hypothetical protein